MPTLDGNITQFKYWRAFRSTDRASFHPDIEYIHLLDEPKSLADFLKWAEPDQDDDDGDYDHYFAVGFAATLNKRPKLIPPGGIIKRPSCTHLKCQIHPHHDRVLNNLNYDTKNHRVVSYQRRSYKKNGKRITAPHPLGMSGGALIGIRERNGEKTAHLCGIITEYVENRAAILATKIGLVRKMLLPYRKTDHQN